MKTAHWDLSPQQRNIQSQQARLANVKILIAQEKIKTHIPAVDPPREVKLRQLKNTGSYKLHDYQKLAMEMLQKENDYHQKMVQQYLKKAVTAINTTPLYPRWVQTTSTNSTNTLSGAGTTVPTITGTVTGRSSNRYYQALYGNTYDEIWDDETWKEVTNSPRRVTPGQTLKLPDGTLIIIDNDGNYVIEDKDAKVVYKARRIRDFNPYMNASDMLAKFVEYVGGLGITKAEFKTITIDAFIAWLIVSAAEHDGEEKPPEEVLQLEHSVQPVIAPVCLHCRVSLPRERALAGINFCSGAHMDEHLLSLERRQEVSDASLDERRTSQSEISGGAYQSRKDLGDDIPIHRLTGTGAY